MHKINLTILNFRFQDREGVKAVEGLGVHDEDKQNTIATKPREDRDYIHMGEGITGGNNQESGMTSDR